MCEKTIVVQNNLNCTIVASLSILINIVMEKWQHFSKKCCIFYLTTTISDINSNTLPLITLNFKNLFALY